MTNGAAFAFCVLLCFGLSGASLLTFLKTPRHDGVARVKYFDQEQIAEVTAAVTTPGTNVVIVDNGNVTDRPCSSSKDGEAGFPEIAAQFLSADKVTVISVKIKNTSFLSGSLSVLGIHVFVDGKHYNYRGKRDITTLVSYLKKLRTSAIKVINGKLDKLAFDAVQQTKLVGFFVNGTGDFEAFETAAKNLAPDVPFYVVFDRLVAKHLKLDTVGQIHLHKPSHKLPIPCTVNPASTVDIENFVKQNGVSAFLYLTEDNLEDTLLLELPASTVIAIGERATSVGGYFDRLLTKVIRNNTDPKYESLNVIWIDPDNFPIVSMMKDYLSKTYGMPSILPAMGVIEFSTNKSAWFSSQLLNMTADKQADVQNVAMIKEWLSAVINNSLPLLSSHGLQSLIRAPKDLEVEEGSTFELDCIVQNVVGDCLWLRNGQNIGFNLARLSHVSWVGDTSVGDCSIRITGATSGRDDGNWVCEVTGDTVHSTLSSTPVDVIVKPKQAAKPEQVSVNSKKSDL